MKIDERGRYRGDTWVAVVVALILAGGVTALVFWSFAAINRAAGIAP